MSSPFQALSQSQAEASIRLLDDLAAGPEVRRHDLANDPNRFTESAAPSLTIWQAAVLSAFRSLVSNGETIHIVDPSLNHLAMSFNPRLLFEEGATIEELVPTRFVANRWGAYYPLANGDSFAFVDPRGNWALSLEENFERGCAVILLGAPIIEKLIAVPPGLK